ncbi:MAG: hypothetical protein WC028_12320 [Candidatus Obscuribacterales bacterium]
MKTISNKENTKLLWQVTLFGIAAYVGLAILSIATRFQERHS